MIENPSARRAVELRARSKAFAIRIVRLFRLLPRTEEARLIGRQVLRSGTSMAANYRAVCRSRSMAEFVSRMGIVIEESDETVFWLELLVDTGIVRKEKMDSLIQEADELLRIFAASRHTAKSGVRNQSTNRKS